VGGRLQRKRPQSQRQLREAALKKPTEGRITRDVNCCCGCCLLYFSLYINLKCGKGRWEVNYPFARRSRTEVQVIPPAAYATTAGVCHSQTRVHPTPIPTCWNGLFSR